MTSVHPTRIEAFGTHCSLPECHLGDFLPFTCTYCTKPYCSSHRTPESHQCPAYDAAAQDVRATICPLCQEAIPVSEYGGRNADINIAMDAHFENGRCKVLNQQNGLIKEDGGNAKKLKGQYQCKFGRCENRNWADIRCDKCGKGYCPSHREPKHHKCAMASTTASSSSTNVNLVPAKPSSSSSNTGKPSSFPVKAAFSKLTIASPTSPNASSAGAQSGPSRPVRIPSLIPSSLNLMWIFLSASPSRAWRNLCYSSVASCKDVAQ